MHNHSVFIGDVQVYLTYAITLLLHDDEVQLVLLAVHGGRGRVRYDLTPYIAHVLI